MDSISPTVLAQVLVENDYHFLPAVTEHVFELCRGETSRLTIRRVRPERVRSAAHFVANSMGLSFRSYPPTEADVAERLGLYRVAAVTGPDLLDLFRGTIAGHGQAFEEAEDAFRSVGPTKWAARLVDEWNWRCGVCRTRTEFVYLEWFTTA